MSTSGSPPVPGPVHATRPPRTVVLVLEATFPRNGGGGAESQVFTLARCLRQRGVHPIVVAPRVPGGPSRTREMLEGFEVVRIPYPHVRLLGGVVLMLRLAALLVARRKSYGAIHAHIAHNMAATAVMTGLLLRKPVFVKITGMHEMHGGILDPAAPWPSRLRLAAIRHARAVQATSTRIGKLLAQRGFAPSRIALLPNGVDMSRFAGASGDPDLRRGLCGDAHRVGIFVGRLSPEKCHSMLLEAWAGAFASATDAKLLLVGEGTLRASLEAQAKALGIASQVVFAGHRSDIAALLSVADFALLTSDAEGLSNALLEYMAAGLPVVGSRVSGTEDFITEGETGWLFEPGDGEALARQLATVRAAPAQALVRLGSQARARVRSLASLEAVTDRLLDLYGFTDAAPAEVAAPAD
jgi:L-malate glycosyltransferase